MESGSPRVLVISSHAHALVQAVDALRRDLDGGEVHAASTLEQGAAAAEEVRPDVVFLLARSEALDDCLEFCRWLRSHEAGARASLVLVYPSRDVNDWRRLYEARGDMFIAWDGNIVEGLASCVKSLVGRRYRMVAAPLRAGALQLFPEGLLARIGGRLVSFTPTEFRVVRYLVEHAERVVSREELAQVILTDTEAALTGEAGLGETRTGIVYQYISQIRKKLAPDDGIILNVYGLGYRIDLAFQPAPR